MLVRQVKHAVYQNGGCVPNVITNLLQRLISISTYCEGVVNCSGNLYSLSYRKEILFD